MLSIILYFYRYFFDSSKSGIYQICYFNAFLSLALSVFVSIVVDLFFVGTCLYISAMYEALDENLMELNNYFIDGTCKSQRDVDIFKFKLRNLLEDHIKIIEYVYKRGFS
jgi:hypothetical protein